MRVFIKTYNHIAFYLDVKQTDLIADLMLIVSKKLGISIDSSSLCAGTLIYNGKNLSNHTFSSLISLDVQQESTLYFNPGFRGGGCQPTYFSNLSQSIYREFSLSAPKYRTVCRGLNLQGFCRNQKCDASNHKVWCQKGFGKFIINKETKKSLCPLCQTKLQGVENVGLYKCKAIISGMKQNGQEYEKTYIAKQKNLLTFEDKDEAKCNWAFGNKCGEIMMIISNTVILLNQKQLQINYNIQSTMRLLLVKFKSQYLQLQLTFFNYQKVVYPIIGLFNKSWVLLYQNYKQYELDQRIQGEQIEC